MIRYHHDNFAAAVQAAEMELRGKREVLAGFLHWGNDPQMGVCERDLWEVLCLVRGEDHRIQGQGQGQQQEGEHEWAELSQEIEQAVRAEQEEAEQERGSQVKDPEVNSRITSSASSSAASAASSASCASSPPPTPLNHSTLLADLHRPDRETITEQEATNSYNNLQSWLDTASGEGLVEAPENLEIPLYDSPISDEMIERFYSGEFKDGMDVDIWEERQRDMAAQKAGKRVEGRWLED